MLIVAGPIDRDANVRVGEHFAVRDSQMIATAGRDHALISAGDAQRIERDVVRADDVEHMAEVQRFEVAVKDRSHRAALRAFDAHAGIVRADHNVLQHEIIAGIDMDHVPRPQIVSRQQRGEIRHWRIVRFSIVQVASHGMREEIAGG